MDERLLSTKQLANYLNCSHMTVRRLMLDGIIPYYRLRRNFRFKVSEVEAALLRQPEEAGLTVGEGMVRLEGHDDAEEEPKPKKKRIKGCIHGNAIAEDCGPCGRFYGD